MGKYITAVSPVIDVNVPQEFTVKKKTITDELADVLRIHGLDARVQMHMRTDCDPRPAGWYAEICGEWIMIANLRAINRFGLLEVATAFVGTRRTVWASPAKCPRCQAEQRYLKPIGYDHWLCSCGRHMDHGGKVPSHAPEILARLNSDATDESGNQVRR